MFPATQSWPRLTRALVLALLSGVLLLEPTPLAAARAEPCDLTGKPDTSPIDARKGRVLITVLHDASGSLDQAVDLQLTITFVENRAHGNDFDRVSGTVVIPAADPPAVLVATGEVDIDCDDLGTDITSLTVPVKSPSGGDGVVFFDVTDSSQPVPGSRLYVGNLTFTSGDTTLLLTGVEIVVKVLDPGRATTSDERRRAKGGMAGKSEQGKRHR